VSDLFKNHRAHPNLACFIVYSAGLRLQGTRMLSLYV